MNLLAQLRKAIDRRLARKLTLRFALMIAFSTAALAYLAYSYNVSQLRASSLNELSEFTGNRAREAGILFRVAENATAQLRDEYVKRLDIMGTSDPRAEFDRWFERWPDGLIRVRRSLDDHRVLPSVYLRASISVDAELRRKTLAAFQLLREWGPIMTGNFYSAYIDLPGIGLIMYSPSVNWGAEATPETNNFDYPPVQNASPAKNPTRRNNWTEVYFDDKAGIYMVSTVTPIDRNKTWIAAASQDVGIQDLLKRTGSSLLPETYNMIISRDGHLIAHPQFEAKLKESGGNLLIADLADPRLKDIYRAITDGDDTLRVIRSADSRENYGIARIDGPDWYFVTVLPDSVLQARALKVAQLILVTGCIALLLIGALVYAIINTSVRAPLIALENTAEQISAGRSDYQIDTSRRDELGQLARTLDQMAHDLVAREGELRDVNAALEERVQERTAALKASNAELAQTIEHLNQARNELLNSEKLAALGALVAGVAHELNTPIGNGLLIASSMQDLLLELDKRVTDDKLSRTYLVDYVKSNLHGAQTLMRSLNTAAELVSSFKQVAVDQTSSNRRDFMLDAAVSDTVATLMPRIHRSPFRIETDIEAKIRMDSFPGAIAQIITNLVNNAMLHAFDGRDHGTMFLSARLIDPTHVCMSFSDDGVGITEANLRRVCEPFFTTKFGQGGSGLGLHVVYNLVHGLLGGRLHITSTPGEGTVFNIELPLTAPISVASPAAT